MPWEEFKLKFLQETELVFYGKKNGGMYLNTPKGTIDMAADFELGKEKFVIFENVSNGKTRKTNNSKFTKDFINKNKGDIPVHSASKFPDNVDYGYVMDNLQNIKYFENCLTWNIDGSVGTAHYRIGRFSLSEKVIPLVVQNHLVNKLDVLYLKYIIQTKFSEYDFGFANKAGKGKIQDIDIAIPIDFSGDFDLAIQQKIAGKYQKIEEIKKMISIELEKIQNIGVDFTN